MSVKVDMIATFQHYLDHCRGVWEALPDDVRGDVYVNRGVDYPDGRPFRDAAKSTNLALCAGIGDTRRSRGASILCEHGVGQSYAADRSAARNSAYAGGDGRGNVILFLSANEQCAARDRAKYPKARVEVIGSPYLQYLKATVPQRTTPNPKPVVAISGHWSAGIANETLSAWGEFHHAFAELAADDDYVVIGHGHPRIIKSLAPHYTRMGVETVASFEEVLARADVFVCDNSSSQFLAAAMGIPNVVLDSKWYRDLDHGGRFWNWSDIGPRIKDPDALPAAVRQALKTRPWPGADKILADVFPVEDPTSTAVDAIVSCVNDHTPLARRR